MLAEKLKQIETIIDDPEKYHQVVTVMYEILELHKSIKAQKQADGIAAAKQRGVRFGRPPKPLPKKFKSVYDRYERGHLTATEAAVCLDTNRVTFKRMVERYKRECV